MIDEYLPRMHFTQSSSESLPKAVENVPAEHSLQEAREEAPDIGENVPRGQAKQ